MSTTSTSTPRAPVSQQLEAVVTDLPRWVDNLTTVIDWLDVQDSKDIEVLFQSIVGIQSYARMALKTMKAKEAKENTAEEAEYDPKHPNRQHWLYNPSKLTFTRPDGKRVRAKLLPIDTDVPLREKIPNRPAPLRLMPSERSEETVEAVNPDDEVETGWEPFIREWNKYAKSTLENESLLAYLLLAKQRAQNSSVAV